VPRSVCLSVCWTQLRILQKLIKPTELPFGILTRVGPTSRVQVAARIHKQSGNFWGIFRPTVNGIRNTRRISQPYSVGGIRNAAFHCSNWSCPAPGDHFGIARSVRLSVPQRSCLGYRHAGCLQLSHRRPSEMCGLRTRPRTNVNPPRFCGSMD